MISLPPISFPPIGLGFYSRSVFPRFYDCLVDTPDLAKHRQQQLANVSGKILEIGVGTGLNLPHYPENVNQIATVDPNPGMNKRLRRRLRDSGISVDQRIVRCEQLPFDRDTFDCVVSTLTLCSIANIDRAVAEMLRVLKPGGRFLFLEHGLSPDANVAKWQQRLNGVQRLLADGCRLTVDVRAELQKHPFRSVEVENCYLAKAPKTHGYLYRGVAVK